jgi:hypothetical protein
MLRRSLDVARSLLAIARAAGRVSRCGERRDLLDLVSRLRSAPRGMGFDPRLAAAVLERVLTVLPPYRTGRCVKRSLYLLDLWSRAGLAPSLHLGIRASGEDRGGHAWITTRDSRLESYRPPDVVEAFRA